MEYSIDQQPILYSSIILIGLFELVDDDLIIEFQLENGGEVVMGSSFPYEKMYYFLFFNDKTFTYSNDPLGELLYIQNNYFYQIMHIDSLDECFT